MVSRMVLAGGLEYRKDHMTAKNILTADKALEWLERKIHNDSWVLTRSAIAGYVVGPVAMPGRGSPAFRGKTLLLAIKAAMEAQ